MSIKIMSLVWEHYPAGGGELLTALAYADHAHDDGNGVRPSVPYMARKTRQSERTIQMHVASMRESTWLLVVRYAGGGRGRATEYRINPAWVSNPAGFAPFDSIRERAKPSAAKGAIDGGKGCKASAPQPTRTVIEPTTGDQGLPLHVVDVDSNLHLPSVLFDGAARGSAMRLLARCPAEQRQAVLDELAGLSDRGVVRHPIGLLRRLVELATDGAFIPSAAVEYRRDQERREAERQRQLIEDAERRRQSTPEALEASRRAREAAMAKLGLRRRLSPSVAESLPRKVSSQ